MLEQFIEQVTSSFHNNELLKITLSKSRDSTLKNIYVRPLMIKNVKTLSFLYRNQTNDITKNLTIEEGTEELLNVLKEIFNSATLLTIKANYLFQRSKKGKETFTKCKPTQEQKNENKEHDRIKKSRIDKGELFLNLLGVTNNKGEIIPKMADKYRQINKYLEIIESLIKEQEFNKKTISVIDMGSGKGYLTFALYRFLTLKYNWNVEMVGVELRPELVDLCNEVASKCGFKGLAFEAKRIEHFSKKIDVLIALHACDTATDDALSKAILSNSQLVITAPCCHKQVRQQTKGKTQESPLLKYGVFKERQLEMVTDTIRALILEKYRYKTKVFEFVSNEHTRKNVMLVGVKGSHQPSISEIESSIDDLKKEFHIDYHYLEKLV